ncbi:MAG: hypothetical protein Q8P87_00690 [bacterium]|nr:hypothetical protein [bacterium]
MPKLTLLIISLIVIILTGLATVFLNSGGQKSTPKSEIDTAVNQAAHLYRQEKERGRDLSSGPCLSDDLLPGWVVDIAHSPRLSVDDLPGNQCPAYREGRAKHFVELDQDGNLIRAR